MMTDEQNAAYVISQSVCAMIEAMGMVALNQYRTARCETIAYDDDAFSALIDKYGIHHNAVCTVLQGR